MVYPLKNVAIKRHERMAMSVDSIQLFPPVKFRRELALAEIKPVTLTRSINTIIRGVMFIQGKHPIEDHLKSETRAETLAR